MLLHKFAKVREIVMKIENNKLIFQILN